MGKWFSLIIGLVVILATSFCFGIESDDVTVLVDEDYFRVVLNQLHAAKESIYVEMYLVKPEKEGDGYVFKLADGLIKAHKRGVGVKVVLENASWHDMNERIYDLLSKEGIDVRFDTPDKVLHSKVIVIDGEKTIIGSHNWSYYGLRLNHEAGVLIESGEIAQAILNGTYKEREGDVTILNENSYFSELINAIKGARESIYVAMFHYQFNPARRYEATSRVTRELIAAKRRGVDVHIVLDQNFRRQRASRFGEMESVIEKRNLAALRRLEEGRVDCEFDTVSRVTHSKLVVIDKEIFIVGSQNWTRESEENDELSLLVKCKPAAEKLLEAIAKIETEASRLGPGVYDDGYAINVPWEFFTGIGSKMYTNQAFKAIDLYLLLLWEWDGNTEGKVELDYERLTELLAGKEGIGKPEGKKGRRYPFAYFRMVKRVLRDLDRKYGLIRYDENDAYLLDLDNRNKPYRDSRTECVPLPIGFWDYGWTRRLSMKAKYVYFINLIERQRSSIKPWWYDSQERLSQRYGISVGSIMGGLLELQRHNLIEIYRFTPKPGEPYWHRWSNQYYINELEPPDLIQQSWKNLETRYGKINLKRAVGLADRLNEPQDPQIVERFIQLIEEYGYRKVKKANNITARLRVGNPKRHIGYTISILKEKKRKVIKNKIPLDKILK